MRAALCQRYGPPDVIAVTDVEPPPLARDTVRVRVVAAAVNFPDVLLVANSYQVTASLPFVPGSEFAGVVSEVGADVDTLTAGQRVFGSVFVGAFADEVVVSPSALTPIPAEVSFEAAAAFGVAYRTAYHALRSVADVQPGDELVVLGAGGGVGLAAVQLGALLGASVTAVASSPEKLAAACSAGAVRFIDHRSSDLRRKLRNELPAGATIVVDPVGGALSEPALRGLAPGGRFVTIGYASGTIPQIPLNLVLLKDIVIRGFELLGFLTRHPVVARRNEAELLDLLAAGKVTPQIHARFDLADTPAALAHVAAGKAIGKVVIDIAPRRSR